MSLKDLSYVARKIVDQNTIKKIKTVTDKRERIILYEYTIKAALEFKYAKLKDEIKRIEKRGKDIFIVKTKLHLLGSKVHFFNATMYKKDFKIVEKMFKEIEKELKK